MTVFLNQGVACDLMGPQYKISAVTHMYTHIQICTYVFYNGVRIFSLK